MCSRALLAFNQNYVHLCRVLCQEQIGTYRQQRAFWSAEMFYVCLCCYFQALADRHLTYISMGENIFYVRVFSFDLTFSPAHCRASFTRPLVPAVGCVFWLSHRIQGQHTTNKWKGRNPPSPLSRSLSLSLCLSVFLSPCLCLSVSLSLSSSATDSAYTMDDTKRSTSVLTASRLFTLGAGSTRARIRPPEHPP